GHTTIGAVAQLFLNSNAASFVQNLLGSDNSINSQDLAGAATWADRVKFSEFPWSRNLHFADAQDNEGPNGYACGYNDLRDCPDGRCLIGAISNYTQRLQCSAGLDSEQQNQALKFLTHFLGDVTQPLHICKRERGGNDVKTTFDGTSTELHATWDVSIPVKRINNDFNGDLTQWASHLSDEIKSGAYSSQAASWLSSGSLTETNSLGNLNAAVAWATDANKFDCSVVWPYIDQNPMPDTDLGGDYYTASIPTVEIQIAKAGYRLADWLNRIFD
ncbi:nuclease Le1, partial [Blyttiomyces helicus]